MGSRLNPKVSPMTAGKLSRAFDISRSAWGFQSDCCGRKAAYVEAPRRAREAKERQNGANGTSDIEGKVVRVAASRLGNRRVSTKN